MDFKIHYEERENQEFPGGPVAKTPCSQCRGPRFIPGQGNRPHPLRLKIPPMATKIKDPRAATKIQHSQINKYMFEKKGKGNHKMGKTFESHISDKGLVSRKIEGSRRRGRQRLDAITDPMDMSLSKLQGIVKDREAWSALQAMGLQRVRHN